MYLLYSCTTNGLILGGEFASLEITKIHYMHIIGTIAFVCFVVNVVRVHSSVSIDSVKYVLPNRHSHKELKGLQWSRIMEKSSIEARNGCEGKGCRWS